MQWHEFYMARFYFKWLKTLSERDRIDYLIHRNNIAGNNLKTVYGKADWWVN